MDAHTKAALTAMHKWCVEMMTALDPEFRKGLSQGQNLTEQQKRFRRHVMNAHDALKAFEVAVNTAPER